MRGRTLYSPDLIARTTLAMKTIDKSKDGFSLRENSSFDLS